MTVFKHMRYMLQTMGIRNEDIHQVQNQKYCRLYPAIIGLLYLWYAFFAERSTN